MQKKQLIAVDSLYLKMKWYSPFASLLILFITKLELVQLAKNVDRKRT